MSVVVKVSENLLERYRYINVEDVDWYSFVLEDFTDEMERIGIRVENIHFDLHSPGRGACFEGCVWDWTRFLTSLGYNNSALIDLACNHWSFCVRHKGHYCHLKSVEFETNIVLPDGWDKEEFIYEFSPYPDDDVRSYAWYAVLSRYNSEVLEERLIDVFTDYMRDLYERLEEAFDYLTSDEVVAETIIANGLLQEE